MNKTPSLSSILNVSRIFAIISVIMAHAAFNLQAVNLLYRSMGRIGVPVFLIISGYYYRPQKFASIGGMLKNKIKSIFIPWLCMGSLYVFALILVNLCPKNPITALRYLIGFNTPLYYLFITVLCYILMFRTNKKIIIGSVFVSLISIALTYFNIIPYSSLHITAFMNVFNWIGFFAAGMAFQKVGEEQIVNFIIRFRILFIILFIVENILLCIFKVKLSYFMPVSVLYELSGFMFVVSISSFALLNNKLFNTCSNMTFGVYFIHIYSINILKPLYLGHAITEIIAPFAVAVLSFILLYAGYFVASRLRLGNIYCCITGIRMDRKIY